MKNKINSILSDFKSLGVKGMLFFIFLSLLIFAMSYAVCFSSDIPDWLKMYLLFR